MVVLRWDFLPDDQVRSASGFIVRSVYSEHDSTALMLEKPGIFAFTRGIYPSMYRERLWTMRQYSGFGNPEETNRRFRFLIGQGQTGLSVAFDLPTQLGYDSDSNRAQGEVGRVGVPISTLENMEVLMRAIALGQVSTSMTINATAAIMLAMYVCVGARQGVQPESLRGTTQNDILKEYIARNTYIFPPDQSLRLSIDIIQFCAQRMPLWHPISISGYHIRESGATAVQELAYAFANAKEYVRACVQRGLAVDVFSPHLSFFFAAHNDLFEEIAKFRAARRIWAHIMKDEFHAQDPESMKLRFHTQTSGETLTAQQPLNNVVRVTVQALAAILGGTQSLHTNSLDEALSLTTEEAVKLALRTQQILAYETGVTKTVDPVGGSYYLESLTSEIETATMDEIEKVDKMGGALKAIQKGYVQAQIRESAFRQQMEIESAARQIVGVNILKDAKPQRIPIHRIDSQAVAKQIRSVKSFKRRRQRTATNRSLRNLKSALLESQNLVPLIIDAVKSHSTTGEISDVLRETYGEYHPRTIL